MPQVIVALDQGTTSSRAIVFNQAGEALAVGQREFPQLFPKPGWVEHDPEAIWSSQRDAAIEAIGKLGLSPSDIAAVGITNQRETTLVWDRKTGAPMCNAIVWQDRRTSGFCDELKAAGHQAFVQAKTGLVIDAYFSASKLRWILDHVPGARSRADAGELAFGTVDTWLIYKLTGGAIHATDVSNASRTMLFDIRKNDWCDELLALFDVPRSLLPEVRSSSEMVGHVGQALPELRGVPIAGVAGDQQAALFGQTCFERGLAKCTYGTGCFMLMNVGHEPLPSKNQLLTTTAWRMGAATSYAHEGSVFIGGAVVQWLRDGLGVIRLSDDIEALAASVPDSGGVYLVPAFAGLGAPHWDQHARGTITGLTRGTTAAHLARAALEGIAFQVADVLEVMEKDSGLKIRELRVDGGAARNDLLMQFQADLIGVPVVRPRVTETTALGAAYLAGLAVGFWKDVDSLRANWAIDRCFEPTMSREVAATRRRRWDQALKRALDWEERT